MVQKFMRIAAVCDATGMNRSWIYDEIKEGRFPKPIKALGKSVSVWAENEIAEWQREQLANRDGTPEPKAA